MTRDQLIEQLERKADNFSDYANLLRHINGGDDTDTSRNMDARATALLDVRDCVLRCDHEAVCT